jgi:hypothetical protein
MQFGLRTLIVAFTACAVVCALFFAVPLIVEVPILMLIVLLAPSFWICGACFAQQPWRSFFLGGIVAGWVPHLVLLYLALYLSAALFTYSGAAQLEAMTASVRVPFRLAIAGGFLLPGLIATIGGGCGMLVYRWFGPLPSKKLAAESSQLHEPYVLLESRVTPLVAPSEGRPDQAVLRADPAGLAATPRP